MTLERDGLFDVSVHKILVEADLQPETIFQCLLAIPGTSFSAKADSMYLKGQGLKAYWSPTKVCVKYHLPNLWENDLVIFWKFVCILEQYVVCHLSYFCVGQNQFQKLLFHLNQFWEAFEHKMGFNTKGIQNLVFETDFTTYLLLSLTQLCHLLHGSAHWKLVGLRVNHGLLKNRRKKERKKVNFFPNQSGFDSFAQVVHTYLSLNTFL